MTNVPDEGWTWLHNATKWHYFVGSTSLCGNWMNLGLSREQGNDDSPDNCGVCRRRLAARKEKNGD